MLCKVCSFIVARTVCRRLGAPKVAAVTACVLRHRDAPRTVISRQRLVQQAFWQVLKAKDLRLLLGFRRFKRWFSASKKRRNPLDMLCDAAVERQNGGPTLVGPAARRLGADLRVLLALRIVPMV